MGTGEGKIRTAQNSEWRNLITPWHSLVHNPQMVAQAEASTVHSGCYCLWAFGWLLLFPGGCWAQRKCAYQERYK